MDDREYILQEIRRVASAIEPEPLTVRAFKREGKVSETKVRYHFGTWNDAVKAAGLKPNPKGIALAPTPTIDENELLEAIGELWCQTGRPPTENLMNFKGKFSVRPYYNRWGSFSKAVQKYRQRYGEPKVDANNDEKQNVTISNIKTDQSINSLCIPKTHKPKAISNRRRILFGEPIDFRGLRYAPVNEQGVVYLFGMVSRELGFLIESIRTDYPDCEGKRALDATGSKWQHVRIEFEYKSKNFVEHGHDPDGCDIIVCWVHNWKDCPIEVLELKTSIDLLPSQ